MIQGVPATVAEYLAALLNSTDNQLNIHHHRLDMSPLLVGLFGVLAGSIIVAMCHCIIVLCNSQGQVISNSRRNNNPNSQEGEVRADSQVEDSTVQVIIQSKYSKECKEDLCSICLVEFKEGEGVRVLSECAHIFHVLCIDKWLENHYNCPLCRSIAVPQSQRNAAPSSSSSSSDGTPSS